MKNGELLVLDAGMQRLSLEDEHKGHRAAEDGDEDEDREVTPPEFDLRSSIFIFLIRDALG